MYDSVMRSAPGPKKRRSAPPKAARPREKLASLKVSAAFKSFVLAQFEALGDVVPRSMFGGIGLYRDGIFFGIIARDTLFLKVDDRNRRDYERAKMTPFKPYAHRSGTMQYFAVPVDVLESPEDLAAWARKSIAVAEGK